MSGSHASHANSASSADLRVLEDGSQDQQALALFREFCISGDPDQFRLLFEREAPRLISPLRMLVARHRSHRDPGELLTDTFAQVFRSRHSFRLEGRGSFRRWFLIVARNLLRQDHRDDQRRGRRERLAAHQEPDHAANPYHQLVQQETQDRARQTCEDLRSMVMEGMESLSPGTRKVLLLHSVHRWKYREIAESLGMTTSAVAMRIKRARAQVLDHVMRQVGPEPGAAELEGGPS